MFTATSQKDSFSLTQIWDGSFKTQDLTALHSMKNGKQYSVLNFDRSTGSTSIDLYDYATFSKIKSIDTFDGVLEEAFSPMSVCMTLKDDIDISRGDMLVRENNKPTIEQDIDVMICWMNDKKMIPRGKYTIRHTSQTARCIIKEVKYKMDVNTLHRNEDDLEIGLNDIGRIKIRTTKPLFFDSYRRNRNTGSIILVDGATNETVAGGMII